MRHIHYEWDKMGQGFAAGSYELTTLPGCAAVCVSHGLFIEAELRGKGLGKAFAKQRPLEAYEHGYDAMICTVDMANEAQVKCLNYAGWKLAQTFKSRRTGHTVGIFTLTLEIANGHD